MLSILFLAVAPPHTWREGKEHLARASAAARARLLLLWTIISRFDTLLLSQISLLLLHELGTFLEDKRAGKKATELLHKSKCPVHDKVIHRFLPQPT